MPQNRAAWLPAPKAYPLKIDDAPYPTAGPGEVVIRNAVIALNPADWKIQEFGMIVQRYPAILGGDAAGYVEKVGEGVKHLEKRQRVMGYFPGLGLQDNAFGTFQLYSKTRANLVSRIPDDVSFEGASVLPVAVATAAVGLYKREHLGLPLPKPELKRMPPPAPPTGRTLLVWGGSSSVGGTAVQLAAASGLRVVATASERNFDRVRTLGAAVVVDYHSESVVRDIVAAVSGGELAGVYDAVSTPETLRPIGAVLDEIGPRRVVTVLPNDGDFGKNVLMSFESTFQITEDPEEVGDPVWREFVPEALKTGRLLPKPDPEVVGKGLEAIQGGLDKLKRGVSATKLVVQF